MPRTLPKTLSPKRTQEAISAYLERGCGSLTKVAKKFGVTSETLKAILAENDVVMKPAAFGFGRKTPYGIPIPTWTALKGRKRPRKPRSPPGDKLGLRAEVVRAKFLRVAKGRLRLLRAAGIYVNCTAADAAQEAVAMWFERNRDVDGYMAMTRVIETSCGPCHTKGPAAKLAFQGLVDGAGLVIGPSMSPECEWDCAAYDGWRSEDRRHALNREARRIRWLLSAEKKSVKAIPGERDREPADVEMLMQCVNALDERRRDTLLACYGIGMDQWTQEEVAEAQGVTRGRIQQLVASAERKIRARMERLGLSEAERLDGDNRSAGSR